MRAKTRTNVTRKRTGPLKLPDDFLGTVRALLKAPPMKKGKKKRKSAKKRG
jgi:hypothetical protein